jgi:phosphate starvation-inducible protein PhoH and related proteins
LGPFVSFKEARSGWISLDETATLLTYMEHSIPGPEINSADLTTPGEASSHRRLTFEDSELVLRLSGPHSALLREVGVHTATHVSQRGSEIHISGAAADIDVAARFLSDAAALLMGGLEVRVADVSHSIRSLRADPERSLVDFLDQTILVTPRSKPVAPKTAAQKKYIAAIRKHALTFGIGPAGTGKTYLAMAMAAAALVQKRVKRIILTRPAVEAGERLGFLPGDLAEKVNPYLRPLYDALNDMLDYEKLQQLRSQNQIEVAPLAFMRGRTLNDCFVVLDEAQNATSEQMKMFLTRLGYGSTAVVTGDVTQTDLPRGTRSGLRQAREILSGVDGIAFCEFSDVDVVRHPLVQRIVVAYDAYEDEQLRKREAELGAAIDTPDPTTAGPTKAEPTKAEDKR